MIFGCANQAGEDNRNIARMAVLLAGMPEQVSGSTINRLCGSGMNAVINAAHAIMAGEADLIIAGGVENMSRAPFVMPKATAAFSRDTQIYDTTIGWRFVNPITKAQFGIDSMPETAENVAEEFHINRIDQDAFALRSQEKAAISQNNDRLAKEISPVMISNTHPETLMVDIDEHPRRVNMEQLASLKTLFRTNGTITAGNSSGINDGAATMIVASYNAVKTHGLKPLAKFYGSATAGVSPRVMGIGPVPATKKLCARLRLEPHDFGIIELNEAFAAQAIAVLRQLGIDETSNHINPNGGAIALGHPLGMSGTRIVGTAALELQLTGHKFALVTMCVGVGQGISVALEAV